MKKSKKGNIKQILKLTEDFNEKDIKKIHSLIYDQYLDKTINKYFDDRFLQIMEKFYYGFIWFYGLSLHLREMIEEKYQIKSTTLTSKILNDIYNKESQLPIEERIG